MGGRVDLDAVQARADAASEGPWAWEATGEKDNSWAVGYVMDEDEQPLSGELEHGQGIVVEGICEGIDGSLADAAFIAHARSDVPSLVTELQAARAVVRAARRVSHSPEVIGHTEDSAKRLFDLSLAVHAYDQPAAADQPPGVAP